jgi:ABC-type nitrate/sulfonate/bicarbonate transport system substrate-binding protein
MREITVGVVAPAYVNVPLWIAQEREFLERRGLAATERICGTTHGVTSALRDGEVDIALTAPEGSIADAVADVVPDGGHPARRGADARRARPDVPGRL